MEDYLLDEDYGVCCNCGEGSYELGQCPHCFRPCCYDCQRQIEDEIYVCPSCEYEYTN